MCGFQVLINPSEDVERVDLERISLDFAYRGPDFSGFYSYDKIHFVHNRLSIIDTSDSSNQPILDHTGRYVLVFNGEIYNFESLYDTYLDNENFCFRESDTSVLLYLLIQKGECALELLDGMFGFVFYDKELDQFIVGRDWFGEKPLYYSNSHNGLNFASDLKSLKSYLDLGLNDVSHDAIHSLLCRGYIESPRTIWKSVFALRPGHYAKFQGNEDGSFKETPYRPVSRRDEGIESKEDFYSQVESEILKSVESRLRSDVEVGLFLSGGIDSGVLLGACNALGKRDLKPLSIDFEEKGYSEFELAKETAEFNGYKIERCLITKEYFFDNVEEFYNSMQQPTIDGFNTYFISKVASEKGIKVWLSGVGGDELFAGYRSSESLSSRAKLISSLSLFRGLGRIGEYITRDFSSLNRFFGSWRYRDSVLAAYDTLRGPFTVRLASKILASKANTEFLESKTNLADLPGFQMVQKVEQENFLRSQLLPDIDAFSMASSIEVRAPFLNNRLNDFLHRNHQIVGSDWVRKDILKVAMDSYLSKKVINQKKSGFAFPINAWMKDYARDNIEKVILDERYESVWDLRMVKETWNGFLNGKVNWDVIWPIYTVNKWLSINV